MPVQDIHIFQNCASGIEDFTDPSGEVVGRAVVIVDNESGETWRYPMPLDAAKRLGQRLMGIGEVQTANGHVMTRVVEDAKASGKLRDLG